MKDIIPAKKQSPILGLTGMGGGVGSNIVAGGAGEKVYAEEIFANARYVGNTGTGIRVYNGINLDTTANPPGGGMIMSKDTGQARNWVICDTARGTNKYLSTNSAGGPEASHGFNAYYTDGFNVNNNVETNVNEDLAKYQTFTFKKQKGFFDVVKYTGTGAGNSGFAHELEAEVGFMVIKNINSGEWYCYHNKWGKDYYIELSNSSQMHSNSSWLPAAPTSTHFYVNNTGTSPNVNQNNVEYIAYLWAGAQDTNTATSRSVDFDGSGDYLITDSSSDYTFGTGDFTVEHWISPTNVNGDTQVIDGRMYGSSYASNWCTYITTGGSYRFFAGSDRIESEGRIPEGHWSHIAIVRSSGVTRMYVNGVQESASYTDTNDYDNTQITIAINGPSQSNNAFNGKLSNIRVLKGTALYTTSFKPPLKPLTSTSNTKLLCCNNSSVTGTTTGTVTLGGDPTASIDTPFFDPESFIFGDGMDQQMVQCGEYRGDGSSNAWGSMTVHLGWEPDWLLVKDTSNLGNRWRLLCTQNQWGRAPSSAGLTNLLFPDKQQAQQDNINVGFPYADGFAWTNADSGYNGNDVKYIYIAIRRPDGLVAKPVDTGTDVFQINQGTAGDPNFKNNPTWYFRSDFMFERGINSSEAMHIGSRLTRDDYWIMSAANAAAAAAWLFGAVDYQNGYAESYYASGDEYSWTWKRGAGMDVVCYRGNGQHQNQLRHNLGIPPEMIWVKRRATSSNAGDWIVGHKDLHGGVDPWNYYLVLNKTQAENNDNTAFVGNQTAWSRPSFVPTNDVFAVNSWDRVNASTEEYVAFLFASVSGVSKCGTVTTDGINATSVTTGFQPKMLIIKIANGTNDWFMYDTTRGWGAGNDSILKLNSNNTPAQNGSYDVGAPTATGFTLPASYSSGRYIYYAHA